ncbi:U3 snoRNP protein [Salix suchowensis]|nr:U3 snoRNP protein [Salix suchowensis]
MIPARGALAICAGSDRAQTRDWGQFNIHGDVRGDTYQPLYRRTARDSTNHYNTGSSSTFPRHFFNMLVKWNRCRRPCLFCCITGGMWCKFGWGVVLIKRRGSQTSSRNLAHDLRTTLSPMYPDILARLLQLLTRSISAASLSALLATFSALFKFCSCPQSALICWKLLDPTAVHPEIQRAVAEVWGSVLRRLKVAGREKAVQSIAGDLEGLEDASAWCLVFACKVRLHSVRRLKSNIHLLVRIANPTYVDTDLAFTVDPPVFINPSARCFVYLDSTTYHSTHPPRQECRAVHASRRSSSHTLSTVFKIRGHRGGAGEAQAELRADWNTLCCSSGFTVNWFVG